MTSEVFLESLVEEANNLGLKHRKDDETLVFYLTQFTGLSLKIRMKNGDKPEFDFGCRTNSWYYIDERTDIHDTISLAFALFLKCSDITSSFLFDVSNPATGADDEIYLRYIIPYQSHPAFFKLNEEGLEQYKKLVVGFFLFEQYLWGSFDGCPCSECKKRLGYSYDYKDELEPELQTRIHKAIGTPRLYNLKDRKLPTWNYYRDFGRKITIVYSPQLADFLFGLAFAPKKEELESMKGKLILAELQKNYIDEKVIQRASKIFKVLEPQMSEDLQVVTLENKAVFCSRNFILSFDKDCGLNAFKVAKEELRARHQKEFALLFADSKLKWKDYVKDDAFEDLIKDLLEREPNVIRVRKVSHTNEPDGSRDLIAEIQTPTKRKMKNEAPNPNEIIKVIVQCKAMKGGVGKSDVVDVKDTIEHNDYQGYFLAVSSYTKRSLTDFLDRMRTKGEYWIDWWTRQEIDERLKRNPDLIAKYPEVFDI